MLIKNPRGGREYIKRGGEKSWHWGDGERWQKPQPEGPEERVRGGGGGFVLFDPQHWES